MKNNTKAQKLIEEYFKINNEHPDDENFDCICGHKWEDGALIFELHWLTNQMDYPLKTANYILDNN